MNNKKGFTLVELLGVITILGLLAALIFPTVSGIIRNARIKSNDSQKKLIIDAAELWVTDNDSLLSVNVGSKYKLFVEDIKKGGYLKNSDIKNLEKDINLTSACVFITTQSNSYSYDFQESC